MVTRKTTKRTTKKVVFNPERDLNGGKRGAGRRLSQVQVLKLGPYILAEYTKSKLDDVSFAKQASKELGFAIRKTQIGGLRRALEVPTNFGSVGKVDVNRITRLEKLVGRVYTKLKMKEED